MPAAAYANSSRPDGNRTSAPVVGLCADHSATEWDWMTLSSPRVMLAARGSIRLITAEAIHILPAGQAAWIPSGLRFSAATKNRLRVWTVDLDGIDDDHPITVFRAPPLMREMARTTCAWQDSPPRGAPVNAFAAAFAGMLPLWRQDAISAAIPTARSAQLRRALAHLLNRLGRPIGLADAALAGAMSERTLQRRCRNELEMSLSTWLTRARILHSLELLSCPDGDRSVAKIARSCGYHSPAAFTRAFSQHLSSTPSAWRTQARMDTPEDPPIDARVALQM
jgi:AraC-like DNA-binding protein